MLSTMRWGGLFGLLTLGFLLSPVAVSAHADYERSEPGRNEVLPEPPARVDVWFTQEVFKRQGRNFVRVFDEQEVQVSESDGIVDDDDRTHIYAMLPSDLPEGRYIVRWMTTSDEDGDTDDSAFCFYVGVEPTGEQAAECAVFDEDVPDIPTAVATATEPAATTPTELVADATPTAGEVSDEADGADDDGVSAVVIVVATIAGAAVLIVVVGAGIVWLRRTLM